MLKIFLILILVNCEIMQIISQNIIKEKAIQNEILIKMTTDGPDTTARVLLTKTTSALSQTTSGPKTTTLSPMDLELAKLFEINIENKSTTSSPYDDKLNEDADYDDTNENVTLGSRTTLTGRRNCLCMVHNRCARKDFCARKANTSSSE